MEKEGVFTGSYAINPITKDKIPVYVGNFVIADYGSGMVMAVPAHDQRDFEFAKKYEIPIKVVIDPIGEEIEKSGKMTHSYTEKGNLVNSGEFNGINNEEAKKKITEFLEKKKLGKKVVQFKLRDWLISRQRYWGTPIPIVYCDKCGIVSVKEEDLPIKLPRDVKFGKGNPLATNEKWIKAKCPKCGGLARRETDTMDTFVNSSWYFLRYCDSKNSKKIFDEKKVKYWMPIDQYIGGAEHACMHLIYCRFYTKFLRDIGLLNFDEPAKKLFHQGMLHGEDGEKMSKSRGNTVDPIDVIKKYSADSLRLALMSFASPDSDTNWDEKVLIGNYRFLNKIYEKFINIKVTKKTGQKINLLSNSSTSSQINAKTESKLNKIIKEVSENIENFKYNIAIIKLRELFEYLPQDSSKDVLEKSLKLLHPFCPHITEELWEKIGNKGFISLEKWPEYEEKKVDIKFEKQEEAMDKIVADVLNIQKIIETRGETKEKVYVYVIPNEKENYSSEEISKRVGKDVILFAVNDSKKYDPQNISKKSKPGKPGIYFE
jgi:leucyl-tRNA synthetase